MIALSNRFNLPAGLSTDDLDGPKDQDQRDEIDEDKAERSEDDMNFGQPDRRH